MLLRIDDTDPARNVPGGRGGDPRGSPLARDRVGRRPRTPERTAGALPRGCRRAPAAIPGRHASSGRRHRDLPARERRRRHRLRDHPRDPRLGPPAERGAPSRAGPRARRRATRVHPLRTRSRPGREEALEARRGRVDRLAPRRGNPAGGGARLPRGARHPEARRAPRPGANPLARGRRARRTSRR